MCLSLPSVMRWRGQEVDPIHYCVHRPVYFSPLPILSFHKFMKKKTTVHKECGKLRDVFDRKIHFIHPVPPYSLQFSNAFYVLFGSRDPSSVLNLYKAY